MVRFSTAVVLAAFDVAVVALAVLVARYGL